MTYAIIGRILASWFTVARPGAPRGPIVKFLHDVTDPVMNLAKKLPHKIGMLDLSPIIALIGLDVFTWLISELLIKI